MIRRRRRVVDDEAHEFAVPEKPTNKVYSAYFNSSTQDYDPVVETLEDDSPLPPIILAKIRAIPNYAYELQKSIDLAAQLASYGHQERTPMGVCSARPTSRDLFCTCCKFLRPKQVIETRVVTYLAKFFNVELYRHTGVFDLYKESVLGDPSISPEFHFFTEYLSPNATWRTLVDSYLSRVHWRGVGYEIERVVFEWFKFMNAINLGADIDLFSSEVFKKEICTAISPLVPPKPPYGDFLVGRFFAAHLRVAVEEGVEVFFNATQLNLSQTGGRFLLCNVSDRFTFHEDAELESSEMTIIENVIEELLLKPERHRRRLNACRERDTTMTEVFFAPVSLPLECFRQRPEGNGLHEWEATVDGKRMCSSLLNTNGERVAIWTKYEPLMIEVHDPKLWHRFYTCYPINVHELLGRLAAQRPFEDRVKVEFLLIPTPEAINNLGFIDCDYSILMNIAKKSIEKATNDLQEWMKKNLVANVVEFKIDSNLFNPFMPDGGAILMTFKGYFKSEFDCF